MLVASFLLLALNLGTGIITARVLGPAGRGELAAITVLPQTLAYMATLGVQTAVVFYVRTVPERARDVLSACTLLAFVLGLCAATVGAAIVVPVAVAHYGSSTLRTAQLFMLLAPTVLTSLVLAATLQARLEFRTANAATLTPPLLLLVALIMLARWHRLTPVSAALGAALPALVVQALVARHLFRAYGFSLRGARQWLRPVLGYGIRAYPFDLVTTVVGSIDQALVIGLMGPIAVGWYTVAVRASRLVATMQQAVAPVLFSRASGQPKEIVMAITGRAARVTLAGAAVGAALLALAAAPILRLIYGSAFLPAAPVFRLLLLEALLAGLVRVLGQAFFALARPGTIAGLQAGGLGFLVCLLVFLVPRFGIIGAGLALLTSTGLRLLFILGAYRLVLHVALPSFALQLSDVTWIRDALRFRQTE